MRTPGLLIAVAALLLAPLVHAQALETTCHASSSYDVTLKPGNVLFDRASPAPIRWGC